MGTVAVAVPFVGSWSPSARAKTAGAPVEANIGKLQPGQLIIVKWRGKPVWVVRRDDKALETLSKVTGELRDVESDESIQPEYAKNEYRSRRPEILVMEGICTHLGLLPDLPPRNHQLIFKAASSVPATVPSSISPGRVYAGVPAPTNLTVPPHYYVNDERYPDRRRRGSLMSDEQQRAAQHSGLMGWIDARFPLTKMFEEHLSKYYAPKNFNFWYFFGSLALLVLVHSNRDRHLSDHALQTGWRSRLCKSVEYIMRDVDWGWLIRYLHSTGRLGVFRRRLPAHVSRADLRLLPETARADLVVRHVHLSVALMAEAFHGLPVALGTDVLLGCAGYHLAVRCNPDRSATSLTLWIRGDFVISDATLNRFFALHVVAVPLVLLMLVVMHIIALHEVGSNNPDGDRDQKEQGRKRHSARRHPVPSLLHRQGYRRCRRIPDTIQFRRVFHAPEMGGYFLEYAELRAGQPVQDAGAHRTGLVLHAVLRDSARDSRTSCCGVILQCSRRSLVLFVLPWIDRGKVRSVSLSLGHRCTSGCWPSWSSAFSALAISARCRRPRAARCSRGFSLSVTSASSSACGG